MRDYILKQAEMRDSTFAFPKVRRAVRNWIARRQLRDLMSLDDYLLNDIGLTRDDLRFGLGLPHDVDPIEELIRVRNVELVRGRRRK
jgi:uncharacterized protein YjiS (DUF1127 family)